MGRPPLKIGTFGEIFTKRETAENVKPEKWRASTRYRALDGRTRQMERYSTTEKKAIKRLKDDLADVLGSKTTLTASSRFEAVAKVYLDKVQRNQVGTTYDRYKTRLNLHANPAFGGLTIRECTAGRFKAGFDAMERAGLSAATRRGIRTVVSGVMQEAVDEELIDANPVRSMAKIKGGRSKKAVAYDAVQLVDFLAKVDADKRALRSDLPDLLRFLFGTGARFGEALAVRWRDLNLTDEPMHVVDDDGEDVVIPARGLSFNGNIVYVSGKGLVRHSGKTYASTGEMVIPEFLYMLLLVRRPIGAGLNDPVFPSETLGWKHPSNVQRSVRRLRERIEYPKFTTHIGRKSVATILDQKGHSAREIAAILRHSKPSMTQDVYMAKGEPNPRAAATLDGLHRAS